MKTKWGADSPCAVLGPLAQLLDNGWNRRSIRPSCRQPNLASLQARQPTTTRTPNIFLRGRQTTSALLRDTQAAPKSLHARITNER